MNQSNIILKTNNSTFKIKHSKLLTWFAFSLMEEDAFELKRKIGEVMDV